MVVDFPMAQTEYRERHMHQRLGHCPYTVCDKDLVFSLARIPVDATTRADSAIAWDWQCIYIADPDTRFPSSTPMNSTKALGLEGDVLVSQASFLFPTSRPSRRDSRL